MTLCNKLFKNPGWVFSPAMLLTYVRLCCALRSPLHLLDTEVQPWQSIVLEWMGLCGCDPRVVSAAVLGLAGGSAHTKCWPSALEAVVGGLLCARCLVGASRTVLVDGGHLRSNEASLSLAFVMLVLKVMGKFCLLVKWHEALLPYLVLCGSKCSTGRQLVNGGSGSTSTWKKHNLHLKCILEMDLK